MFQLKKEIIVGLHFHHALPSHADGFPLAVCFEAEE